MSHNTITRRYINAIEKNQTLELSHIIFFNTLVQESTNCFYDLQLPNIWEVPANIKPVSANSEYFQIIYLPGHFIVCYYDTESVYIYDSMNSKRLYDRVAILLRGLFPNIDLNTVKFPRVQQQINAVDCGVFSMAFIVSIIFGLKPEKVKYDQNILRKHLLNMLKGFKLVHFPQNPNFKQFEIPRLAVALQRKYDLLRKRHNKKYSNKEKCMQESKEKKINLNTIKLTTDFDISNQNLNFLV